MSCAVPMRCLILRRSAICIGASKNQYGWKGENHATGISNPDHSVDSVSAPQRSAPSTCPVQV